MFLEAKQSKLLQSQPNGHATIIGLNASHNNSGACHDSSNNIKIPPRPPIRSTTTTTTMTGQSSPAEKQSCLASIGSTGISGGGNASGLAMTAVNSISNESPNIKFALTTSAQHKQHQQQQQALPQAAMNEMRV